MPPPTKHRRVEPTAVEEITFDLAARQDYLTGFHKRKVQRTKQAQEAAEKRARAERIESRKRIREDRKAELERHVAEVNALLRPVDEVDTEEADSGSSDEWDGLESPEPPAIDHEAEYIDEDKYTTVTVEALDVSREGLMKAAQESQQEHFNGTAADDGEEGQEADKSGRRTWTKERPREKREKPKKKRKKFRYESKAERKVTRRKEHSKNKKQARERKET